MTEYKCKKCKGKLFLGKIQVVEIKCKKCGYINHFSVDSKPENIYSKTKSGEETFEAQS